MRSSSGVGIDTFAMLAVVVVVNIFSCAVVAMILVLTLLLVGGIEVLVHFSHFRLHEDLVPSNDGKTTRDLLAS